MTAVEEAPEESSGLGMDGTNTIFSSMEADLVLKYLLISLLEERVAPE